MPDHGEMGIIEHRLERGKDSIAVQETVGAVEKLGPAHGDGDIGEKALDG